jgi:hypothetical protein
LYLRPTTPSVLTEDVNCAALFIDAAFETDRMGNKIALAVPTKIINSQFGSIEEHIFSETNIQQLM